MRKARGGPNVAYIEPALAFARLSYSRTLLDRVTVSGLKDTKTLMGSATGLQGSCRRAVPGRSRRSLGSSALS